MAGFGLELPRVDGSGDCFYLSVMVLASDYLRGQAHSGMPEVAAALDALVRAVGGDLAGVAARDHDELPPPLRDLRDAAVQALRNWLADRLAADFARFNTGVGARYHFEYPAEALGGGRRPRLGAVASRRSGWA